MKKIILFFIIFIAGSYSTIIIAQTKNHFSPKPHAQIKQHVPKPKIDSLKQTISVTGQTGSWTNNEEYVYDGFYLQTNAEKQQVKFPLNMGSRLKAAIKPGDKVTVNGVTEITSGGVKEISMISLTIDGQTIYVSPPIGIADIADEFVTGSSTITELQKTKKGVVFGFLLSNNSILKMTNKAANQLSKNATPGANISYTGIKKSPKNGEVLTAEYTIVKCNTITLNGIQYVTN